MSRKARGVSILRTSDQRNGICHVDVMESYVGANCFASKKKKRELAGRESWRTKVSLPE